MDQTGTLAELFEACGYPYEQLEEDTIINIEDQGIEIASYDHDTKKVIFKKVISLRRKHDSEQYILHCREKVTDQNPLGIILRGTENHKVYDPATKIYVSIKEAKLVLDQDNDPLHVYTSNREVKEPVLDIEVEDTHCYFTNGILSHNTAGGNALKFYASQRIDIRRIGGVKDAKSDDDTQFVGNKTRLKVVKNKIAPPFKQVEFVISYGHGIDKEQDVLEVAIKQEIIQKSGAWYAYGEGGNFAQGAANAAQYFRDHPEMYQEIYDKLK